MSAPRRRAFTLIEIIVILLIVALMIVVIIPVFIIHHRKAQSQHVLHDLKTLDAALHRYALETEKQPGFNPTFQDLKKYLDPSTDAYRTNGKDAFGHPYGPFTVDSQPKVPAKTAEDLSGIVDDEFWSTYR